jgi:hypothetical protein
MKKPEVSVVEVRLRNEIRRISNEIYILDDEDADNRIFNLRWYRDEIYRSFVINIHLGIEELLEGMLIDQLKSHRLIGIRATSKYIKENMKSLEIIEWCARLGIISKSIYAQLIELNKVRNAVSHNWTLNQRVYKKIGRKRLRKRVPIVQFNGKNLLNRKVFVENFVPEYSRLYVRLYQKS